ncbi:hypothetical protein [Paenibacillus sedimenti]|uniref:Uncharacterized protein n=1 Tax=Paenibacillus sedimenti TaxID=2770274 RepID=A0A926KPN1_9BACL|nr:hypothetical protein [Paenibacillus sedimenti]MBD0381003.1 hypothetical protein [Paenibacillus sedimenti]
MLKKWTTWSMACLISLSTFVSIPIHISAVDDAKRTSLVQPPSETVAVAITKPAINTRSELPLADSVNKWKLALSREQGFENWQQAAWHSYPLGPGTHGWVIILGEQGHEVGYMIVHAAEDGSFRLTEFGTGDSPLFSLTTLYRSLVQQELISDTTSFTDFIRNDAIIKERLYMDSLTAIWKISIGDESYYLDAKSGELLPLDHDPTAKLAYTHVSGTELSGSVNDLTLPAFDPYERLPWVQGKPLHVVNLNELKGALKQKNKLTYVTELYDNQVTLPLAVIGYKQWGHGEPYLAVDHVGPRYVLLKEALEQGNVYP